MPTLTNIPNTQSISLGQIATYAAQSLSNVSVYGMATIYSGVPTGAGQIALCQFYSNGCEGAPPTLYFVEYLYGANATVACDYGSEANMFYVDAPFILDVTKIYTDVAGTIYAPTAYYSSAGDGVWIRWSNTGIILSSGICDNPI